MSKMQKWLSALLANFARVGKAIATMRGTSASDPDDTKIIWEDGEPRRDGK